MKKIILLIICCLLAAGCTKEPPPKAEIFLQTGHSSSVRSVSFSPDGRFIASGSADKTVKLWDAASGKELRTFAGHSSSVNSVSFSPDGRFIASGSSDNTVKLWDLKNGKEMMTMASLPGNQWISYQPGKPYYNSSLQGDEYAAVRFDNKTWPVYPLTYYRDKLKKENWKDCLSQPPPDIRPMPFRLWWDETSKETLWQYGIVGAVVLLSAFSLSYAILKKRSDPFEVSKKFFPRAGFKKAEVLSRELLRLAPSKDQPESFAAIRKGGNNDEELIENIKRHLKKPDTNNKLYIIHGDKKPKPEAMQTLRKETKCWTIPLQSARMVKALYSRTDPEIATELREIEDPFIIRSDPYSDFKPIGDSIWFYGRNRLMHDLPSVLAQGQHVGLFGLRKVGKTSLIKQLQRRFVQTPLAMLDCQNVTPKAEIYFENILSQIYTELRGLKIKGIPRFKAVSDAEDFRRQFFNLFDLWEKGGNHEPFILVFDEIDKFFPERALKNSEEILLEYVRFFKILRGMAQTRQCLVILAAAYRPHVNRYNLLSSYVGENPMFSSFQEYYLGFLSCEDSTTMIREIGLWKNIVWEEDAARKVFYYCGGHPLVTRHFASMACNEGELKHIDEKQVEKIAAEILRTFHMNPVGNYYQEGIWNYLDEEERKILQQICDAGKQEITAARIPEELENALANVQHFGLVTEEKQGLCLTANLFYEWMRK